MVHAVGGACASQEDHEGDAGHDDEQLTADLESLDLGMPTVDISSRNVWEFQTDLGGVGEQG